MKETDPIGVDLITSDLAIRVHVTQMLDTIGSEWIHKPTLNIVTDEQVGYALYAKPSVLTLSPPNISDMLTGAGAGEHDNFRICSTNREAVLKDEFRDAYFEFALISPAITHYEVLPTWEFISAAIIVEMMGTAREWAQASIDVYLSTVKAAYEIASAEFRPDKTVSTYYSPKKGSVIEGWNDPFAIGRSIEHVEKAHKTSRVIGEDIDPATVEFKQNELMREIDPKTVSMYGSAACMPNQMFVNIIDEFYDIVARVQAHLEVTRPDLGRCPQSELDKIWKEVSDFRMYVDKCYLVEGAVYYPTALRSCVHASNSIMVKFINPFNSQSDLNIGVNEDDALVIMNLRNDLVDKKIEIENLKVKDAESTRLLKEAEGRLAACKLSINTLTDQVSDVNGDLVIKNEEKQSLIEELNSVKSDLAKAKEALSLVEDSEVGQLVVQLAASNAKIKELEAKIDQLVSTGDTNREMIAGKDQKLYEQKGQIDLLTQDKLDLSTEISSVKSQLTTLVRDYKRKEDEIANLRSQISEGVDGSDALNSEIDRLESECAQLNAEYSTVHEAYVLIKAKYDELIESGPTTEPTNPDPVPVERDGGNKSAIGGFFAGALFSQVLNGTGIIGD